MPFSKDEVRAGKTPDFRVLHGGDLFAYCEVKSPRDESLDDMLDQAEPFTIVRRQVADPIFNRLSKIVEKAAKQFDAVNPDRSVPNILAIVNHDDASHRDDLTETLTGMFHAADGARHRTIQYNPDRRLEKAKHRIDLYVWIDGSTGRAHQYVFSESVPAYADALCAKLGIDKAKIRR